MFVHVQGALPSATNGCVRPHASSTLIIFEGDYSHMGPPSLRHPSTALDEHLREVQLQFTGVHSAALEYECQHYATVLYEGGGVWTVRRVFKGKYEVTLGKKWQTVPPLAHVNAHIKFARLANGD